MLICPKRTAPSRIKAHQSEPGIASRSVSDSASAARENGGTFDMQKVRNKIQDGKCHCECNVTSRPPGQTRLHP